MEQPVWMRGVIDGMAQRYPEHADGWLVLTGPVPERWRERAVSLHLIPLLPVESNRIVAGAVALPGITVEDEPLLRTIARGSKTAAMAKELGIPKRTLERKLERLRRQLKVTSTADLIALLARLGFANAEGEQPELSAR